MSGTNGEGESREYQLMADPSKLLATSSKANLEQGANPHVSMSQPREPLGLALPT